MDIGTVTVFAGSVYHLPLTCLKTP